MTETKNDDTQKTAAEVLDPFAVFDTDAELENEGVQFYFGDYYIQSKSSDSGNRPYTTAVAEALRPIRQALRKGQLPDEVEERFYIEAFAEHCAVGWGGTGMVWSKNHAMATDTPKLKELGAMPGYDKKNHGKPIEFSVERLVWLLQRLPRLWNRLRLETASIANYRREEAEEVGNG